MKVIQIIEDDPDLRENAAELLEMKGYKITPSASGKSNIEIFRFFIGYLKADVDFIKFLSFFFTVEDSMPPWFRYNLNNYFGCLKKPFMGEDFWKQYPCASILTEIIKVSEHNHSQ